MRASYPLVARVVGGVAAQHVVEYASAATAEGDAADGPRECDVIIIGGGVAGLSAARILRRRSCGNKKGDSKKVDLSFLVLESRNRLGGRTWTDKMPQRMIRNTNSSSPSHMIVAPVDVDLGASYMHGCETTNQPIFDLAVQKKVRTALVAGYKQFEDTEAALWFNSKTGEPIKSSEIARMHALWYKIDTYMGKLVSKLSEAQLSRADVESLFKVALKSLLRRFYSREYKVDQLSDLQIRIIEKLVRRTYGYVSNLKKTGIEQIKPAPGATFSNVDVDSKFGNHAYVEKEAKRIEALIQKSKNPEVRECKREGTGADRLLVDGGNPCCVSGFKTLSYHLHELTKSLQRRVSSIKIIENGSNVEMEGDHCIIVTCTNGEEYRCNRVVCTVPLPVLKNISISPPFSKRRQESLQRISTGAHNKIVLRFDPRKVFWPPSVPQFNCDDPRFQFLNLHPYGKPGIFPPHAFGYGDAKNDNEVILQVLRVLSRMFKIAEEVLYSSLLDYRVTRWDTDVHSGGSYSYLQPGGRYADLREIAKPHPPRGELLYFAGEATALVGFQCVHGAFLTGKTAAENVCKHFAKET